MRHRIAGNRLNRFSSLRKATLRDLAKATLEKQRICTTKAKAKEARKLVDRLVTLGKRNTLAAKRRAFAILCDHDLVSHLFNKLAPLFSGRMGGYTRIIHLPQPRRGDNASLVFLELTEKIVETPKKAPASARAKGDKDKKVKTDAPEVKKEEPQKKPAAPAKPVEKEQPIHKPAKPKLLGGVKKIFNKKSPTGS